jgi:hypothetical protein
MGAENIRIRLFVDNGQVSPFQSGIDIASELEKHPYQLRLVQVRY